MSGQEKLQKREEVPKTIGFDVLLLQLFELVFDDEVMEHLYYQPKLYILIKSLTTILITAYSLLQIKQMNWEQKSNVLNYAVSALMTRNRFDQILGCLCLDDNSNLAENGKLSKLRLLHDLEKKRFLKHSNLMNNFVLMYQCHLTVGDIRPSSTLKESPSSLIIGFGV